MAIRLAGQRQFLPPSRQGFMRVNGPNGTAIAMASATASTAILRTVSGIDALIALQGIEHPTERRRRAVKHRRLALDAPDELKLALLSGTLESSTLLRLETVAADLKKGSGDEKLDQVLNEIELRVAVELAKGINLV